MSADGHAWTRVSCLRTGILGIPGRSRSRLGTLRVESDTLAVYEFQVSVKEPDGRSRLLDWSKMEPYPLSFVRSLTRPPDAAHVWSSSFRAPQPTYDGQELAVPVWLKQAAFVSEFLAALPHERARS